MCAVQEKNPNKLGTFICFSRSVRAGKSPAAERTREAWYAIWAPGPVDQRRLDQHQLQQEASDAVAKRHGEWRHELPATPTFNPFTPNCKNYIPPTFWHIYTEVARIGRKKNTNLLFG